MGEFAHYHITTRLEDNKDEKEKHQKGDDLINDIPGFHLISP